MEFVWIDLPQVYDERRPLCPSAVSLGVFCDNGERNGKYLTFKVRNFASWAVDSVQLVIPERNLSKTVRLPRLLQPEETSDYVRVPLVAAAGDARVIATFIGTGNRSCRDTFDVFIPDCSSTPPGGGAACDRTLSIGIGETRTVAAANGYAALITDLSAGPSNVRQVSATLVHSSINDRPAFGYFNTGILLNDLGFGDLAPSRFGEEVIWKAQGDAVSMTDASPAFFWMVYPPLPPNTKQDTLRFAIRYRITDEGCLTRDSLAEYTVVRRRNAFDPFGVAELDRKGTYTQGDPTISGTLTGENTGTMRIMLPGIEGATFTGFTILPTERVPITEAVIDLPYASVDATHGMPRGMFSAMPGQEVQMQLTYAGLGDRSVLGHMVLLHYRTADGTVHDLPAAVTLRRAGAEGGDIVEAAPDAARAATDGRYVETFALHVRNTNNGNETISGLRLVTSQGAHILAVGPTSSDTEALLRFGQPNDEGHAYVSEAAEGVVSLTSGQERAPIYVTLALELEALPVVEFQTLNELGQTVTTGELDLSIISGVSEGPVTGGAELLRGVWPNPASEKATVALRVDRIEEGVELGLYDAAGRLVESLMENGRLEAGTHVVVVEMKDLASGTYFVVLKSAAGNESLPLQVQR